MQATKKLKVTILLYFVLDHFAFIIWATINGEQNGESVLFVLAKNLKQLTVFSVSTVATRP